MGEKEKKVRKKRSEEISDFVGYWICSDGTILDRNHGDLMLPIYQNGTTRMRRKDGTKDTPVVHRLVAMAFVPNPEGYKFIRFIDGDQSNRDAGNLQWIKGVRPQKERTGQIIDLWKEGYSATQIAKMLDISPQYVNRLLKDKGLKHSSH